MFIDTHCHLRDYENLDATIAEAAAAGVGILVYAGAAVEDVSHQISVCEKYKNIFCTIGIHPEYPDSKPDYEQLLNNKKVIGIGEIGLDYHYGKENCNKQIELFETQLEIARRFDLPVAVHTRDAEDDTADVLKNSGVYGVMHCFTGTWDFAKKMLDKDFFFSASGILTFKNAADLRETFEKIPTDRIVIETDSPWCAPVPYRGKTCTPSMVIETARALSEIKKIPISDIEKILYNNTTELYQRLKDATPTY